MAGAVKALNTAMARDREVLGERITAWLLAHPELQLVDRVVSQRSDDEYHWLTITLFLARDPGAQLAEVPRVVPRPTR